LSNDLDADTITQFVFATYSAERFGVKDDSLKSEIRDAAKRFGPVDYFWFDPKVEPPPINVPEDCICEATNPRGQIDCQQCSEPLTMMSRYEVWVVALIRSYLGEKSGIRLGARYFDVIKWLPSMRPYPAPLADSDDFIWSIYAITHIIYTLNDYSSYRLSRNWLPHEFTFLKSNLSLLISMDDPETVGEMVDSLKSFRLADEHPLIKQATEYLLSAQHVDGSWGDPDSEDLYGRYHATLTAVNALRTYAWNRTKLAFPGLRSCLAKWALPVVS
jgi:hypothetical protein